MRTVGYIVIGILGLLTVCLVVWTARIEKKSHEWVWLHPPNDDDGCSLLNEEDDPDDKNPS